MIPFDFNGWTCTLTRNGHLFQRGREKILVRHGPNRRLTVQRTWLARLAGRAAAVIRTIGLAAAPFESRGNNRRFTCAH